MKGPFYWAALTVALITSAHAQALGPVQLLNTRTQTAATATGNSTAHAISADNRFACFSSEAKDLVAAQTYTEFVDIFVADLVSGTNRLISVETTGHTGGNFSSSFPVLSSNGQFVAFISSASNLSSQTVSPFTHVYLRDTVLNSTEVVSLTGTGQPGSGGYCADCDMTPDGRYVVFTSSHTNLPGQTSAVLNLFLRDRLAQTTELLSMRVAQPTNASSIAELSGISDDGQKIVFTTRATDLIFWPSGAPQGLSQVYLRDRATTTNTCLGLDTALVTGWYPSAASNAVISSDGSATAFIVYSNANYLVYDPLATRHVTIVSTNADPSITPLLSKNGRLLLYRAILNGATNVYLFNAQYGTNQIVNVTLTGSVNGASYPAAMSADGSRVVFLSNATNLTIDIANGQYQIYVRDVVTRTTRLVSVTPSG
ncbi:MAG: TolB family protein, partial [Limisphaerales bacterium]